MKAMVWVATWIISVTAIAAAILGAVILGKGLDTLVKWAMR